MKKCFLERSCGLGGREWLGFLGNFDSLTVECWWKFCKHVISQRRKIRQRNWEEKNEGGES